jgi:hypothetical protein
MPDQARHCIGVTRPDAQAFALRTCEGLSAMLARDDQRPMANRRIILFLLCSKSRATSILTLAYAS